MLSGSITMFPLKASLFDCVQCFIRTVGNYHTMNIKNSSNANVKN